MTGYATADDLLAVGCDEADHTFPDGKKVRIRALPRAIVLLMSEPSCSVAKAERLGIRHGVVAPQLTHEQIEPWMERVGAGYIQGLVAAIQELSGMTEGAGKQAFQEVAD